MELVAEQSAELNESLAASAIVDPRTIPVRFSRLRSMSRSALHYYDACQADRDDTLAMRMGRGAHAIAFGQPVVEFNGKVRNGKVWDAFKAEHAGAEILNTREMHEAKEMAAALHAHPLAAPLLFGPDAVHEQQLEWEWLGRSCTARPDARLGMRVLVDLKTTKSSDPTRFARDALWNGYHGQLAYYGMAMRHVFGVAPRDSYIVAIENKRPYAVTVLHVPHETLEMGERLCRAWFERLLICEQSNAWPAYSESVVPLLIEQGGDSIITIDGEEVEL